MTPGGDVFVARGRGAAYGAEVDAAAGIGCFAAAGAASHTHCGTPVPHW